MASIPGRCQMEAGRLPGACRGGRGTVWALVSSSPWLCGRRAEAGYAGSHVHGSRHHCFRSRFSGLGRGAERVGARALNPLRLPACHFPLWQDQAAGPRARERPAQTASTARAVSRRFWPEQGHVGAGCPTKARGPRAPGAGERVREAPAISDPSTSCQRRSPERPMGVASA